MKELFLFVALTVSPAGEVESSHQTFENVGQCLMFRTMEQLGWEGNPEVVRYWSTCLAMAPLDLTDEEVEEWEDREGYSGEELKATPKREELDA